MITDTRTSSPAEVAASATLATLEKAWNAGDGAAFGAPFTEDAVFVDIRGSRHRSRAAIAAGHQGILDSIYRGSTVRYVVESVDQPAADVAVVHAAATLDAPTGPHAGVNRSNLTLVLVRGGDDGWAVSTFHNTMLVG